MNVVNGEAGVAMKEELAVMVTGSSGFIGSHLCELLAQPPAVPNKVAGIDVVSPRAGCNYEHHHADIRSAQELGRVACSASLAAIHLAARADVVTPFETMPDVVTTNIDGTLNLLRTLRPRTLVFASSCAVYGNTRASGAKPTWASVHPIGLYGMSKAAGEMICSDWARETGNNAIILRLGNVVGKRCRGLVPYLVNHARKYPEGQFPAKLRGGGRIIRDYVPVAYVVNAMKAALDLEMPPRKSVVFNIGSGRGTENRWVAEVVQRALLKHGYRITLDFATPIAQGEAWTAILDPTSARRRIGLPAITASEVEAAVEEAVASHLAVRAAAA